MFYNIALTVRKVKRKIQFINTETAHNDTVLAASTDKGLIIRKNGTPV